LFEGNAALAAFTQIPEWLVRALFAASRRSPSGRDRLTKSGRSVAIAEGLVEAGGIISVQVLNELAAGAGVILGMFAIAAQMN